jgi:hypothetical protein
LQVAFDGEMNLGDASAVPDLDLGDLPDLDTGRSDELAGPQSAGIAEDGRISVRAVEPHLTEYHDDDRGEEQQHQREGAELDGRTGDFHGLIVNSPS